MSGSNIIVHPAFNQLISEREKIWADFDRSKSVAGELNQLATQIPDCEPATLQLQFGADSIPPTEIETVLPMIKEKIAIANRLGTEMKGCYDEIESIKRKQKTVIVSLVAGGLVLLLILIIVVISAISSASPALPSSP